MGKYPSYEKMKDSGIEWLGEVPEHWKIGRLKFYIKLNPSRDEIKESSTNMKVTFLPMENIYENGTIETSEEKLIEKVESRYTYFSEGDVLLAKITPCFENGKSAIAKNLRNNIGFGTTEVQVLRSNNNSTEKFLYYLINSNRFMKLGESRMTGSAGQKRVPTEFINNFSQGFPPLKEQKVIANFLDRETGRIDKLIKKKEELIELLEEKRQATINQAVTKGLNPDVEMKDSGIEWLGRIPEHWEHLKLKYLTNKIIDGVHFTPDYIDEGVPFLRVTDITKNKKTDFSNVKYISKKEHEKLSKRCNPEKGDLLLSKNGTIGVPKVINWDFDFSIFVSLCLIKFKDIYNVNFAKYFFKSSKIEAQIYLGSKTNTVTNLHLNQISEFYFPIPPLKEQKRIVNYLDQEISKIDNLITKIKEQIDNLKEYKQALISNAVTGKIKVAEKVEN